MIRLLCAFLLGLSLLWPVPAHASELKFNITVIRQADGSTVGEVWYNDRVLWRLKLVSDGAQPASAMGPSRTTVVVPDIDNGLFKLKVYNQ